MRFIISTVFLSKLVENPLVLGLLSHATFCIQRAESAIYRQGIRTMAKSNKTLDIDITNQEETAVALLNAKQVSSS